MKPIAIILAGVVVVPLIAMNGAAPPGSAQDTTHPALLMHKELFAAVDMRDEQAIGSFFLASGTVDPTVFAVEAAGQSTKIAGKEGITTWLLGWKNVPPAEEDKPARKVETTIVGGWVHGEGPNQVAVLEIERTIPSTADQPPEIERYHVTSVILPGAPPRTSGLGICHMHISPASGAVVR